MRIDRDTQFYDNGQLKSEKYLVNGKLHRDDGPAYITYKKDGTLHYRGWYKHGKLIRAERPEGDKNPFYPNAHRRERKGCY